MAERLAGAGEVRMRRDGPDWSRQEHAGHLGDLKLLMHQRLDDYAAGTRVLTAADMSNARTWAANHNGRAVEAVVGDFARLRDVTVARLEGLPETAFGRTARHPRLGQPMRLADLL